MATPTGTERGDEFPDIIDFDGILEVIGPEEELPAGNADIMAGVDGETKPRPFSTLKPLPSGFTIRTQITSRDPQSRVAKEIETLKKMGLKVLHVRGIGQGTVEITAWTNDHAIHERCNTPYATERDGTVITRNTSMDRLVIGEFLGEVAVGTMEDVEDLTETPLTTEDDVRTYEPPKQPRDFIPGPRKASQVAVMEVHFSMVNTSLPTIIGVASSLGGTVCGTTGNSVQILCVGEKNLARAAEIAQMIVDATKKDPAIKIGITAKPATLLRFGDQFQAVTGSAVDTLGKIHGDPTTAEEKIVVDVDSDTRAANDPRFETEVTLDRGKRGKYIVWKNIKRSEDLHVTETPLVGRGEEMEDIEGFLRRAETVDPEATVPVLAVIGKPGIGKSKLLYEVLQNLKARGKTAIYVTATPTHSDRDLERKTALESGWLLKELLKKIVETATRDTDQEWLEDAAVRDFFTGIKTDSEIVKFLNKNPYNEEMLVAEVQGVLARLGQGNQPVVMIDNAEAMDEFSARILRNIMSGKQENLPHTSFILAGRTGSGEDLPHHLKLFFEQETTINLKELGADDCRIVVGDQFGVEKKEVSVGLAKFVTDRSRGVPLSIVELCRFMRRTSATRKIGNQIVLPKEQEQGIAAQAEETLESIVADHLGRVLKRTTPEGQGTFAALLALGSVEKSHINSLVEKGIIDEGMVQRLIAEGILEDNGSGYGFTNPVYQDQGRAFISPTVQRETSAQLALCLKDMYADLPIRERPNVKIFRLAKAGGLKEEMWSTGIYAAQDLLNNYHNEGCAEIAGITADIGIQKCRTGVPGTDFKHEKIDILRLQTMQAEALMRLGKHDDAEVILGKLWQTCKISNIPPFSKHIIKLRGNNAYIGGRGHLLKTVIAEWEMLIPDDVENQTLYKIYMGTREEDPAQKEQKLQEALIATTELARTASDPFVKAEANRMVGMIKYNQLRGIVTDEEAAEKILTETPGMATLLDETATYLDTFVKATENGKTPLPDRTRLPSTLARLATLSRLMGRRNAALDYAQRAKRAASLSETPHPMAIADGALGQAYSALEQPVRAIDALKEAQINAASARDAQTELPAASYNLALEYLKQNNRTKAGQVGLEALRHFTVEFLKAKGIKLTKTEPAEIDAEIQATFTSQPEALEGFPPGGVVLYVLPLLGKCITSGQLPVYINGEILTNARGRMQAYRTRESSEKIGEKIAEKTGVTVEERTVADYLKGLRDKQTGIENLLS